MRSLPNRFRTVALGLVLVAATAACGDDEPTDGTSPTSRAGSEATAGGERPTGSTGTDPAPTAEPKVRAVTVAELDEPIMLLPRPGDDRVWVAERAGVVRRLEKTTAGPLVPDGDAVLDITDLTTTDVERGLLGMAFSLDGATVYLSHTDPEGDSVVAAYDVADDGAVDEESRQELLRVEQPYPNHNGGHVVTTADGELWLGLGDGGASDDPENRAQDPDTLLGKLVRVDLSGEEQHEVIASGLRNPWRFSLDADGDLWIADVGQNELEEVNHVTADQIEGANYGWSGYEGDREYLDGDGRRPEDAVMPVFTYGRDGGACSITGGFIYQGPAESLSGAYLYTDYCAGQVRALVVADDGTVTDHDLDISVESPISFGTDADGDAYVLSAAGSVVRLDAA